MKRTRTLLKPALSLLTATGLLAGAALHATGSAQAAPSAATSAVRAAKAAEGRPNVIVIMADDMRQDDLRFMPNLHEHVIDQGVEFANSFSPFPLCCPARASFMTGQYAHNHEVYSHVKPWGYRSFDDSYTIGTAMQEAGYRTAFLGKYLNGYGPDISKVSGQPSWRHVPRGWDQWWAGIERGGPGNPATGDMYNYMHTSYTINGKVRNVHGEYQTNTLGRMSRDIVDQYAGNGAPFFMYLNYLAPHFGGPREKDDPKDLLTPARPDWVKGRFNSIKRAPGVSKAGTSDPNMGDEAPIMLKRAEPNADRRAQLVKSTRQRAESIYVMDREIGELIQRLKATGEWANTVLMFTSDNGYFLGEHRRPEGKVLPHEPSLRVPFVVAGAGVPAGQKRFDPITTLDVTATVAAYGGALEILARHHVPDGRPMVDVIQGGDKGWTTPVLTEAFVEKSYQPLGSRKKRRKLGFGQRNAIGIRVGSYKYVKYANGGQLYHLDKDPNELRNLWRAKKYRDERADLDALWLATKDCVGAAQCLPALPAEYAWDAATAQQRTLAQFRGVKKRSGVPVW